MLKREEGVSFKNRGDIGVDDAFENFAWDAGERNGSVVEGR